MCSRESGFPIKSFISARLSYHSSSRTRLGPAAAPRDRAAPLAGWSPKPQVPWPDARAGRAPVGVPPPRGQTSGPTLRVLALAGPAPPGGLRGRSFSTHWARLVSRSSCPHRALMASPRTQGPEGRRLPSSVGSRRHTPFGPRHKFALCSHTTTRRRHDDHPVPWARKPGPRLGELPGAGVGGGRPPPLAQPPPPQPGPGHLNQVGTSWGL